ncbi:hypothetical protein V8C86DRAFT_1298446 [Haematococcus lacustris]
MMLLTLLLASTIASGYRWCGYRWCALAAGAMSWLSDSILRGKTTNVSAPLRPCDAPVPRVGQERPGQAPPRRRKLARPQHNQEQDDGQYEEYEQQQQ